VSDGEDVSTAELMRRIARGAGETYPALLRLGGALAVGAMTSHASWTITS